MRGMLAGGRHDAGSVPDCRTSIIGPEIAATGAPFSRLLAAFARECFQFSRPRESFAGQRRSLAFEILGVIGGLLDLPDVVELAGQTVKKGRADAAGALTFLETYHAPAGGNPIRT